MLERIAAALEIDAPALFSTKFYPSTDAGTLSELQEQVLSDLSEVISYRFRKFERGTSQALEFSPSECKKLPKLAFMNNILFFRSISKLLKSYYPILKD